MFRKLIGTRAFYRHVLLLAVPIMIQNGITNFVNMLDNVMVGSLGTHEMTGVAVTNQLMFVFNLCIFGAVSGAGIFGAQFFGKGDHRGVRDTFRFKIIFCTLLAILGILLFLTAGDSLVSLYLQGEGTVQSAEASLGFGLEYLYIMLIGLIPYTLVQCYASTLRETGKTLLPMVAGIVAVCVNLMLNAVLIYGYFGLPALGVKGAAIATVISRFVELLIIVCATHARAKDNAFIVGAYRSLRVPLSLVRQIVWRGLPLMLNETLWSAGIATINQCYSVRGLDVVAANNINQTFFNVFSVAFMAVGVSIGIIVGQMLGAGDMEGAKDASRKLIAFSVFVSTIFAVAYAVFAIFIPHVYNVSGDVRALATALMQISALTMPIDAFAHGSYFTLRSGGKTFITFLFDSCFAWCVTASAAYLLVHFTALPIIPLYAICTGLNFFKCVVGYILVKKGVWLQNIVKDEAIATASAEG